MLLSATVIEKSVHTNLWQNRVAKQKFFQGDLYEVPSFYHRRALSVTRYCVKGKSYREIAGFFGGNVSSVPRELRRNCTLQKGTKNLNGLLRKFYPEGRNLSRVSPATLKKNLALINAGPKRFYISKRRKNCCRKILSGVALGFTMHLV